MIQRPTFTFTYSSVDRLFPFVRMRNTIVSFLEQQKEQKKKLFRTWGELKFGLLEPDSNESFFFSCSFNLQPFFFCFMIVCFFFLCYVHLVSFNSQERQCDNSIGSEFLFTEKKVSGMFKYMHRNTMCLGISSNCDDTNLHLLITRSNDKRCLFKTFRRL